MATKVLVKLAATSVIMAAAGTAFWPVPTYTLLLDFS